MEYLNVLAAAVVGFGYGAVHYTVLSKPWMQAAGVKMDANGKPMGNGSILPFAMSIIAMILVAGMMRHVFVMGGIDTVGKSALSGLGIGAFFIAPWTMINNGYAGRPFLLTIIDGAYAIIGCTLMGVVLALF